MEIVMVKGAGGTDPDRTYLTRGTTSERAAVHVVHDLPHLVVESLFGIDDGLWAELEAGKHLEAARASTARDQRRQKKGRIVSGAATGESTDEWLTTGHRRAKAVTNCVTNPAAAGGEAVAFVRQRLAALAVSDPAVATMLSRLDDQTIEVAIDRAADLRQQWIDLPVGSALRLQWPLAGTRDAQAEV